jgi:nucleoid-associated protein YgaU
MAAASSLAAGLEHARLEGAGAKLQFMLNPQKLNIRRQTKWVPPQNRSSNSAQPSSAAHGKSGAKVPLGHGPQQYTGSQPATLSMTVWFDQSFESKGDITGDIDTLQNWTCPTERVENSSALNPPRLTFTWGSFHFIGHISSLGVTYKQFGSTGQPMRAQADIALTENPPVVSGNNPTSGGISGRRVHVVCAGDTLHSISYSEYGSPGSWRALAEANGIDDPLRVTPGTTLLIPPDPHASRSR